MEDLFPGKIEKIEEIDEIVEEIKEIEEIPEELEEINQVELIKENEKYKMSDKINSTYYALDINDEDITFKDINDYKELIADNFLKPYSKNDLMSYKLIDIGLKKLKKKLKKLNDKIKQIMQDMNTVEKIDIKKIDNKII